MIKIKITILLMFFCFAATAQETKKAFTINGQVEGNYNDYIYLRTLGADNIKDSCLIVDKKFKFSGSLLGSTKATLTLRSPSTVSFFYLENSPVEIAAAISTFREGTEDINDIEIKKITGSKTQELMTEVEDYQKMIEKSPISLEEKNKKIFKKYYESVIGNPEYPIVDFLIAKSKKKGTLTMEQIKDLSQFVVEKKKVENERDSLKIRNKSEISKKLDIGKKIEKFTLENQKGKKISISDFKGKYVLINFWASWYKPTRVNNLDLVKVYDKFKNKKFEIVSISIDTYDGNWKAAIEKDKLSWTNLIDTDGWHGKVVTQFEIKGIPLNILIDQSGTIVAVNVWGDSLREKLDYFLNVDSNN